MPIHNYSNFLIYLNEFPKYIFKQEINVSCLENLILNKYLNILNCTINCDYNWNVFLDLKRVTLTLGNIHELLVNETLAIRMYVYSLTV